MSNISDWVRANIRSLKPYSSARDEYTGKVGLFLDANENSIGSVSDTKNNRYPDPHQSEVKAMISKILDLEEQNIFLGNGSDEAIDLLIRIFCEPKEEEIIVLPPTYGMYKVAADINNVAVTEVPLDENFDLDVDGILKAVKPNTKILFICSPNNPTANMMSPERVEIILQNFAGIVVIDEAYIDFTEKKNMLHAFKLYPKLVILRTFSKAWGMANIRLGMAFGDEELIRFMNNVKPPYNVNGVTQDIALNALKNLDKKDSMLKDIKEGRSVLINKLAPLPLIEKIYPSDANFILVKFWDSAGVFSHLLNHKIIVRDRSKQPGCENCLRITVGTKEENETLINTISELG
ncbi:MAG: histidinol-phosphate transaminase [Candidatus Marinimicrobia bacterium]|nr:histidinol-phosphate transaminase [Candidatus Neomarinimicrobiota bacterium]